MIGVDVEATDEAVVVRATAPLTVVSSAVLGGGAGVRAADGRLASGTSADAMVIAAMGRGQPRRFGRALSEVGAGTARAGRATLNDGIRHWRERRP